MFETYVQRWDLEVDGDPVFTHYSALLPVIHAGQPAMLKLLNSDEERNGSDVLTWWDGDGAVRVLARDDNCLLLERAMGERSLAEMSRTGQDDEATAYLCRTAMRLHRHSSTQPPPQVPALRHWFRRLLASDRSTAGPLLQAANLARTLFARAEHPVLLHGDIHHDNVLDFGAAKGWLAIDPKGIAGDRAFDFVNILRNPMNSSVANRQRLTRRLDVIAGVTGLDHVRLLEWTAAFCGLSAVWNLDSDAAGMVIKADAASDLALLEHALDLLR